MPPLHKNLWTLQHFSSNEAWFSEISQCPHLSLKFISPPLLVALPISASQKPPSSPFIKWPVNESWREESRVVKQSPSGCEEESCVISKPCESLACSLPQPERIRRAHQEHWSLISDEVDVRERGCCQPKVWGWADGWPRVAQCLKLGCFIYS